MHVSIRVYLFVHIYVLIYTHICVYAYISMFMYVYRWMDRWIDGYVHTTQRLHIYVNTIQRSWIPGFASLSYYARTHARTTVFGKHCECIAQKCTHLECLPPLASHLLLLSHCVLTQHGGQKKKGQEYMVDSRIRTSDDWEYRACSYQLDYLSNRTQWVVLFKFRALNAD